MSTMYRALIATPLAIAALGLGATPAQAGPLEPAAIDIAQPAPQPDPDPQPEPDPGPQGPGDLSIPEDEPGPHGPGDLGIPDDKDDDDGDDDHGDHDDDDGDHDGHHHGVRRPSRVDAGAPSEDGMNLAWLLVGGGAVTAAGGFTARKVALSRR